MKRLVSFSLVAVLALALVAVPACSKKGATGAGGQERAGEGKSPAGSSTTSGSASATDSSKPLPVTTKVRPGKFFTSKTGPAANTVDDGKPIPVVDGVPSGAVESIGYQVAGENDQYEITFLPIGRPEGSDYGTMYIRIDRAKPVKTAKAPLDLAGRKFVVYLLPQSRDTVQKGGTYTGQVSLVLQGGVLVAYLETAEPAK